MPKITLHQLAMTAAIIGLPLAMTNVAWAAGSKPVRVVNDEANPVITRNIDSAPDTPFAKMLCITDIPGLCDASSQQPTLSGSFVVPSTDDVGIAITRVEIEFVSGHCIGTARSTNVDIASRPAGTLENPDTGDNFTTNRFPLAVAQFLTVGVNGVQGFAHPAKIYLEPGMTVFMQSDRVVGGQQVCRAQLNGHLVY